MHRELERSGSLRPRALRLTSAVAALTLACLVAGCSSSPDASPPSPSTAVASSPTPSVSAPPATPSAAPVAEVSGVAPARVEIGSIGLSESLIPLGIQASGEMEVPVGYDDVGWFTGGGKPGGHGPTVIAAHVDSPTGPAVFARLTEVAVGDVVEVVDVNGRTIRYSVTEVADYPKAQFPTARVFGAIAADELRLITCGGDFDGQAQSYLDNHVVYAERVA